MFAALTVSSLAVLATGDTAGLDFSMGTQPIALVLGAIGIVAASAGLLAIIRWMLDAEETYPDYRYHRAVAAGPAFAIAMSGSNMPQPSAVARALPMRPDSLGDNVVIFDPARARRKKLRAL